MPAKGQHHTAEAKKKIGAARKGHVHSEETKRRISEAHKGKRLSAETRKKISLAGMGNQRLLGKKFTPEELVKISGANNHNYGKKFSAQYKRRIGEAQQGVARPQTAGSRNGNWRGCGGSKKHGLGFTERLKRAIRKRDGHTCQECGATSNANGHAMDVHHVDFDAYDHAPENLTTLCPACHSALHLHREA